jgi:hypothetical protein
VILALFCSKGVVFSQTSDSVNCDTSTFSIVLNCTPVFNNVPLQDGDEINVISNITDMSEQRSSIVYRNDTLNSISLAGTLLVDSAPDAAKLEFTLYSKEENCITSNVEYLTDNLNSSACILSINSLIAEYHEVAVPSEVVCNSDLPFYLNSDVPQDEFTIRSSATGISINQDGAIVPRESVPGKYSLEISTDYCLASDTILIEIAASPDMDLGDTIPVCMGSMSSPTAADISNITFYESNSGESYMRSELDASGEYIAISNEGPCSAVDTVFIDLIEVPEIQWERQYDCDRTYVNVVLPSSRSYEVNWANNITGTENVVYHDTLLQVSVQDESGCIARDSIELTVRKLKFNTVDFSKEEADCWTDGKLVINASEINNYSGSYQYRLFNRLTNNIVTDMDAIPEGVYVMQVVDDRNCIADYEQTIKVEQKCLEDYPVFSPDGDNIEDTYFIPHEGMVSIYNREGILLRKLETPAYWDGTDAQNHSLPMGNYVMITETGRAVNITIVR